MKWYVFLFAILLYLTINVEARQESSPDESALLNEQIRYGKLENGLTYFIVRNKFASGKIEVALSVNVGRMDEDSSQVGLAHLIEHLGLRSTKNFPEGIRSSLIDKGILSSNINASTQDKETFYKITIQSTDTALLGLSLLALRDIAGGINFIKSNVEEERAAVCREISDYISPRVLAELDARYRQLDHNPLYKTGLLKELENIKGASIESIIKFYADWYHPMYQSIIIVGDVDQRVVENFIRNRFSDLSNKGAFTKVDKSDLYDVKLSGKDKVIISEGGLGIEITIFKKQKQTQVARESADYLTQLIADKFLFLMFESRIKAVFSKSGIAIKTPTLNVTRGAIHPNARIDAIEARIRVDKVSLIKPSLIFIANEMKRIQKHGFTETEFSFARKKIIESGNDELEMTTSAILNELRNFHLSGKVITINESGLTAKAIENLKLNYVNSIVKSWLSTTGDTDILISVPKANDPTIPSESHILSWFREAAKANVPPFKPSAIKTLPPFLKDTVLSEVERTELMDIGATQLFLGNGVTVILKSLQGNVPYYQEVLIKGTKNTRSNFDHGLSQCLCESAVFGKWSRNEIQEFKKNSNQLGSYLQVSPSIENGSIQIVGGASVDNAEKLLHLIYLYLNQGAVDEKAVRDCIVLKYRREKLHKSNQSTLEDTISSIIGLRRPDSSKSYDLSSINRAIKIFKDDFSNISDLTFLVSGAFDKEKMISLVETYFGSLQNSNASSSTSSGIRTVKKSPDFDAPVRVTLPGNSVNNVQVRVLFKGAFEPNVRNNTLINVLLVTINQSLRQRLREKEKGVYEVNSVIQKGVRPQDFFLRIEFQTAAADVDRLMVAVTDELGNISKGDFSESYFKNALSIERERVSQESNNPAYWIDYLSEKQSNMLMKTKILDEMTASDIRYALKFYIDLNNYMLFEQL